MHALSLNQVGNACDNCPMKRNVDQADTDGDGLSNYAELVTHSTDPNDSDSDDDTLKDFDEVSIGLDPNAANTALVTFFDAREANARNDGNTSGITYAQANYSIYNLYSWTDKNASDDGNYTLGVTEQIIFPEIDIDKVNKIAGMDITFVTSAPTDKEAKSLLTQLGLPFKNN